MQSSVTDRAGKGVAIAITLSILAAGCLAPAQEDSLHDGRTGSSSSALEGAVVHDASGRILLPGDYPGDLPAFEQRFVRLPHFDLDYFPGWEPMIAFDATGSSFFGTFTWPMDTPYAPTWDDRPQKAFALVASTGDHGKNWQDVSPTDVLAHDPIPEPVFAEGDTIMYADKSTGDVYVSYLSFPCAVVQRTTDKGETWTGGIGCDTQGQGMIDHHILLVGPSRTTPTIDDASMVYVCWSGLLYARAAYFVAGVPDSAPAWDSHRCIRSLDGARTFIPATPPFSPVTEQACVPFMSQGSQVAQDGTIYIPQVFCETVKLAISRDDALTWDVVTVGEGEGANPDFVDSAEAQIAIDNAGNLYVLWVDGTMKPRLAVSQDSGATWGPSISIRPPGVETVLRPTLVAGDEGRIALSYLATSTPWDVFSSDFGEPADPAGCAVPVWSALTTMSLSALDEDPVFVTVLMNPSEDPVHRACGMGGVEDYADNDIHPSTGAVWWSSGDTCHPADDLCPVEPVVSRYWEKPSRGYVAVQVSGTGLLLDGRPAEAA